MNFSVEECARHKRLVFLIVLVSVLSGCDLPIVYESEHFTIRADHSIECLEPTVQWMEHHYSVIGEYLGIPPENMGVIEVNVYENDEEFEDAEVCSERAAACERDGRIFLEGSVYNQHELVHAYAERIGSPTQFFGEGLAEVLGCVPWATDQYAEKNPDIIDFMETSAMRALPDHEYGALYNQAAMFTRYLIDRFGRETYLRFYGSLTRHASLASIRTAFSESFNVSLDDAVQDWLDLPDRPIGDTCIYLAECAMPEMATDGTSEEINLSCGTAGRANRAFALRTFEIPEQTNVRLSISGEHGRSFADIRGCDFEYDFPVYWIDTAYAFPGQPGETWTDLPPGRYWASFGNDEDADFQFSINTDTQIFQTDPESIYVTDDTGGIIVARDEFSCSGRMCFYDVPIGFAQDSSISYHTYIYESFPEHLKPEFFVFCREDDGHLVDCQEAQLNAEPGEEFAEYLVEQGEIYRIIWHQEFASEIGFVLVYEAVD